MAALGTISDRLTEVGTIGSPITQVRITVLTENGVLGAAVILTVADDNGQPYWADCTLVVDKDAPPEVTGRINRMLKGFAIQRTGLTTIVMRKTAPPLVGKHWRTGQISMFHAGRIIPLPVVAEGKPHVTSTSVSTLWKLTPSNIRLQSNLVHGYLPVTAQTARPKRATRSSGGRATVHQSAMPTVAQAVAASQQANIASTTVGGVTVSRFVAKAAPKTPRVAPKGTTVAPTRSVVALPAGHPGIFRVLPPKGGTVLHVDQVVTNDLDDALAAFMQGERTMAALRGPSGAGKTLAALTLAATNGLPFAKFDMAGMRDFGDFGGMMSLRDKGNGAVETVFIPSRFVEAISADGPYAGIPRLVLLDELTRTETAASVNALTGILDDTASLYIPDAHKSIAVDPAVFFVGTANIGASFTGTVELDEAIANRASHWIVVDYPKAAAETTILVEQSGIDKADASKLVSTAAQVRAMHVRGEIAQAISTRQLVQVGKAVSRGRSLVDAFRVAFIQRLSPEGAAASDVAKVSLTVNASLR